MKMVETAVRQFTDPAAILSGMRKILKAVDPSYMAEEDQYRTAAAALKQETDSSLAPSVEAYLAAEETAFAEEILYIGWQGFQLNMDIFNDPTRAVMLDADDEDLHQERRLKTLPDPTGARQTVQMFRAVAQTLPREQQELLDSVTDFYAYLRTVGYKLAHYFGFRLADRMLPSVVPGYISDPMLSLRYLERLRGSLGFDPDP